MPFRSHMRVTALGRLGNNAERFSYNLSMGIPDTSIFGGDDVFFGIHTQDILTPNPTVFEDMANDVRTFHSAAESLINPKAVLEEVKFARIGPDGRYLEDPVIVNVVDAPGGGFAFDQVLPQAALAISLTTDRRGPTGKGRFFIPMPSVILQPTDLLMTVETAQGVRGTAVNLINDLENAPGIDVLNLRVVVASSKGYNSAVSGVRVGRAVDTIQSRRRSIPEMHTAIAGAGGG